MKHKFSLIWRVAVALVLVLSFSLVAAVPVAAASPLSGVSVELYNASTDAYDKAQTAVTYYIYFTPGVALTTNVDTITVRFPPGTSGFAVANTSVDPDGDAAHRPESSACTEGMVAGYNLQVTTPVSISAGTEAYVKVTGITNPTWTGVPRTVAHTLGLYTSQETTEVTSAAYTLGETSGVHQIKTVSSVAMEPADSAGLADAGVAGAADDWLVTFTATTALTAEWDTITVTFPPDVYVPSSINKAYIKVDDDSTAVGSVPLLEAPTIVGQSVSFEVPATVTITSAACVWFMEAAGIQNPTLATDSTCGNDAINTGIYIGKVKTSKDSGIMRDVSGFAQDVGPASPSVVGIKAGSPTQVLAGVASATITIQSKDTYGNLSDVPTAVSISLSSSSTTGTFLGDDDGDGTLNSDGFYDDSTTCIAGSAHEGIFKYKDSAVGTATITASYPAMDWTPATWGIEVMTANVVYLYHGTYLIGTYGTITAALAYAMPGQTVKVTAGTYSEDSGETFPITLSTTSVTLESIDGAATTIIEGSSTASPAHGIIDITGANVVLGGSDSGFTIKTKSSATAYAPVFFASGATNPTVQGNILTGMITHGIWGRHHAGIAYKATIKDNSIAATVLSLSGNGIGLHVLADSLIDNNEVSGFAINIGVWGTSLGVPAGWANAITISNNTCYGSAAYDGISVDGGTALKYVVVSGNDCYDNTTNGIDLSGSNLEEIKVIGNNLYNNEGSGLHVDSALSTLAAKVYVYGNNIYGNTATVGTVTTDDYGIWNSATTNVPAKHNWWGDASGPTVTTNPGGTGDAVSTKVTYSQWLTASIVKGAAAFAIDPATGTLIGQTTSGVDVSGIHTTSLSGSARYTTNPRAAITEFTPLEGGFFDVFVEEVVPATELITIKFYPSGVTDDCEAWYWSTMEGDWLKCSEQDYSELGFVWVKCRQEASVTPPATEPTAQGLYPGVQFVIGTEVVPVNLVSIAASPASVTLDVDGTQQLTVTATYSDASTAVVTTSADCTYVSDDTTVATVTSPGGGLITAVAEGPATITVSYTEALIEATDTVSVTVSVFDVYELYDADEDGVISKTEALNAVVDYFNELITKDQALLVIVEYMG